MEDSTVRYNFKREPPKYYTSYVWLNLDQGFQRRRMKYDNLTTPTSGTQRNEKNSQRD
jgi:hypothetical protein